MDNHSVCYEIALNISNLIVYMQEISENMMQGAALKTIQKVLVSQICSKFKLEPCTRVFTNFSHIKFKCASLIFFLAHSIFAYTPQKRILKYSIAAKKNSQRSICFKSLYARILVFSAFLTLFRSLG